MNQKELEKLFNDHPTVDKFHVTSNDYAFVNENHALDHARSLKDDKIRVVKRSDVFTTPPSAEAGEDKPAATAVSLIKAIGEAQSAEELKAVLPEGESRKTVLAAYDARLAALPS